MSHVTPCHNTYQLPRDASILPILLCNCATTVCTCEHPRHISVTCCTIHSQSSSLAIFLVFLSDTLLNLLKDECYLHYLTCLYMLLSVHMSLALPFSISILILKYFSLICYPCTYYRSCRTSLLFCSEVNCKF